MPKVRFSYLQRQFADPDPIFAELRKVVARGDYTLGKEVGEFEARFAGLVGAEFAIGVASGTDALKLCLLALGIGAGDEVITVANTYVSTIGAIHESGARPVLVDCDDSFCIDPDKIEAAITERTKAIMPVHLTGEMADMPRIVEIAENHGLEIIEDACQAVLADIGGRKAGTWGRAAGFSLHPQKNLNVWGDGGVITTNDPEIDRKLRILRNNGLRNRDEVEMMGMNSRLDTIQAVVGNWLIGQTEAISARRAENAAYYDAAFADIPRIRLPERRAGARNVFHLYMVFAEDRNGLLSHCLDNNVEAKVHYPIPVYRQEGLKFLGYKPGDFPTADRHAETIVTFPADQHIGREEQDAVIAAVRGYYGV